MNLQMRNTYSAATLIAALAVAGCAVGPDFHPPEAPATARYTPALLPAETVSVPESSGLGQFGASQHFVSGQDIPAQWWTLFHSEPLDQLMRSAIADSPTLAAAQAALRQARENLAVQRGNLIFPAVDANLGVERSNVLLGFPGTIYTVDSASVSVSYKLDIFGGSRRTLEAFRSQIDYQDFQLEAAYLTLTSNIVTTVVQEASLRAQIVAVREILAAQEKQLGVIDRQFQLGGVSKADVLAQRTQVAQTRALLPPLDKQLAQTRHRLAVLTGKLPSEAVLPDFEMTSISLPEQLPVSLPSSVVRQRPDIRAAEALLHQASAQIGVATANLYPQISLSGNYGSEALKPSDLFSAPSVAWTLLGGLVQPLFHGGALNAQRRGAVAAYDQAEAQYRETVLLAFQDVADTLRALEEDALALKTQADAEVTAREALDLTQRQFKLGAVSFLTLLNAQRQYQQTHISLVQAEAARYTDTAALFQALGGGWWNRKALADANTPAAAAGKSN
jgi:NodT family efflux transporter outer membrane factor (OMF) lipoprotein